MRARSLAGQNQAARRRAVWRNPKSEGGGFFSHDLAINDFAIIGSDRYKKSGWQDHLWQNHDETGFRPLDMDAALPNVSPLRFAPLLQPRIWGIQMGSL
jgi:hypothetical protein